MSDSIITVESATKTPAEAAYRADIDGLRAIAVCLVVAFHAFPQLMPGGFVGVDVFFVISGYLISGIILGHLEEGRFSVREFYIRRVRRIFPALLLVMVVSLVAGLLMLLPDEVVKLGKHLVAGALFVSNVVNWREAGYFDEEASLKPLLHLWSLGVEEQFYMVWPVLLAVVWRWRARFTLLAFVGAASLSFAMNVALLPTHPSAVFFLPFTRFWELIVGALLAYRARGSGHSIGPLRIRDAASVVGVLLIGIAVVALRNSTPFPGVWALLPTVGAALVLWAGPGAVLNRGVLSLKWVVYCGLISYPLYLWHWPLFSFAHVWYQGDPPVPVVVGGVVLSAVLALATFELVEKPIRSNSVSPRRLVEVLASVMLLVAAAAGAVWFGGVRPLSSRFAGVAEVSAAVGDFSYDRDEVVEGTEATRVLLFGDSHMQQYLPRVREVLKDRSLRTHAVMFHTMGGCAPVPGIERDRMSCAAFVERGLELAKDPRVKTVVLAGSWPGMMSRGDYRDARTGSALDLADSSADWVFQAWADSLRALREQGKRVVLVLSSPRADEFNPKRMVRRGLFDFQVVPVSVTRSSLEQKTASINPRLRGLASSSGIEIVDPLEHFCGSDGLCSPVSAEGAPILTDGSHIRGSYVRGSVRYLDRYLIAD